MSYLKRIENSQNYLLSKQVDFLIIDDPINLLYLSGLHLEKARIIIGQTNARLFVDGRFIEEAKKKSPISVFLYEEHGVADFLLLHSKEGVVKIGFDSEKVSYSEHQRLLHFFKNLEKQASKELTFDLVAIESPLRNLRAIKTQDEISAIRRAASITWKGFEYICSLLKEGVTEKTLALEFELFCRRNGASHLAFDPLICFGPNSAMPHHRSDETRLKMNDVVLIDIGTVVDDYNSDLSRVVFFGEPDPLLEKCYEIVKKAQHKALLLCKPGEYIGDVDKAAREYIEKEGYGKDFLHALGHGVGLEIHEFPRVKFDAIDKDISLKPGMVITIEPGIYKESIGGVRYEDTIVITKDGYENFFSSN